jgi:signal transduction histidine kinase/CheY-like chemotaxis protein
VELLHRQLVLLRGWLVSSLGVAEDVTQQFRALFLGVLLVTGALLSLALGLVNALAGAPREALGALTGFVACGAMAALWRRTRRLEAVAPLFGGLQLLLFAGSAVLAGEPNYLAWLALTPLSLIFLGGLRQGLVWLGLSAAAAVAASLVFVFGQVPLKVPSLVPRLARASLYIPVMALVGFVFEWVRLRTMGALSHARKAAEHANASRGRFLANVSHEIRTPLNGVLGMTEVLLCEKDVSPEVREGLEVISQSGHMLRVLIDDLLDLSRAEAGQLSLEPRPFKPADVVTEVAGLFAPVAAKKGLRFTLDLTIARGLTLVGDPVRTSQVLNNLVANALKFTESGSVVLSARATQRGMFWDVDARVSDTGPGISAEEAEKLFKPFTQVGRPRGLGGTGLGLAISKQLANAMGGDLRLESLAGSGSTFIFQAPMREWISAELTPLPRPSLVNQHSGTVLVVDDNTINARVVTALLGKAGLRVLQAADGAAALALLEERAVDLVLMDCHMPVLDGLEATRRLRERERDSERPRTPVVALTASALKDELDACLAAGMDDCLTKPITVLALYRVLNTYLRKEGSGPARDPTLMG